MTKDDLHYTNDEEIHVGDHILLGGHAATVVVVIGRNEYAPGFNREDWSDHERGVVMRTDNDGQLYMYEWADEDVKLVSRASAPGR